MGAVVTGAGSGFGRAFTVSLAQKGVRVVAADVDMLGAQETVRLAQIAVHGGNGTGKTVVIPLRMDVRSNDGIAEAISVCQKTFGSFDILINNAGVDEPLGLRMPNDWPQYQRILDINLTAVVRGTLLAVQTWRDSRRPGVVVNVASAAGTVVSTLSPVYAASKSGVVHFTRSMQDLQKLDPPIRVCALAPTFVRTPLLENSAKQILQQKLMPGSSVEEVMDNWVASVGGYVDVADVSKAMLRLVTDPYSGGSIIKLTSKGAYVWPRPQSKM
jgi:NAD(P)-dependent dehydrogenase (short-subunit alcohol dehydrogenase family)